MKKMEVIFGGKRITWKRAINYLGVIIDDRLSFKEYGKASVTQGAPAKMMPNIGAWSIQKEDNFGGVTSIMLYAALKCRNI